MPVVAFDPTRLNLPTAREWLADTEPHTLALLLDPEKALAADTEKAARIASAANLPVNSQGRYPMLVWMQVYPG
jgi:hypothetical protein